MWAHSPTSKRKRSMEGWMNSARGHSRYSGFQWPRKMRVKNTYPKFTETFQTTLQHNPHFHSWFVFSACSDNVVKITAFHPEEVWCDEKATHRNLVFSGVERIQDDCSYPPPWRVHLLSYSGSYRLSFGAQSCGQEGWWCGWGSLTHNEWPQFEDGWGALLYCVPLCPVKSNKQKKNAWNAFKLKHIYNGCGVFF